MSILDSIFRKIVSNFKNNIGDEIKDAINNPASNASKTLVFDYLPETFEQFKALPGTDLKDPNYTAALTVLALCAYAKDRDASIEMLNYLKGPRPLSNMEKSFINDRFMDGFDYVPRSYLGGTSPQNDYTPSVPYTVVVSEYAHSRDNYKDGYIRLFIRSSGADTDRFLDLRNKPSTGEWFLWAYEGMLSGIRIPVSKDEWA